MRSTSVHLPSRLIEGLDRLAKERGTSRNRVIVEACENLLAADRGTWPEGLFAVQIAPEDLQILRQTGAEMEEAIYSSRRERLVPPL